MCNIYSQGVAGDGSVILCDGLPLTPDIIVEVLNEFVVEIKQLEAEREKKRYVIRCVRCGGKDEIMEHAEIQKEQNQKLRETIEEASSLCKKPRVSADEDARIIHEINLTLQKALENKK